MLNQLHATTLYWQGNNDIYVIIPDDAVTGRGEFLEDKKLETGLQLIANDLTQAAVMVDEGDWQRFVDGGQLVVKIDMTETISALVLHASFSVE